MNPEISTPASNKQAPIETLPPKPIWKSKLLWGFVLVSTIAAFIIGGMTIGRNQGNKQSPSPTPTSTISADETANWKTYKNSKYNYSLKYPNSFEPSDQTPYSVLFATAETISGPAFPTFYISTIPIDLNNTDAQVYNYMSTNELAKYLSLKIGDSYNPRSNDPYPEFWSFKRLSNTRVDNLVATIIENDKVWEGSKELKDRRVIIKVGNNYYIIGTYYKTDDELNLFNQILSTFKFTNSSQSFMEIKELGIKIPLRSEIQDLVYTPKTVEGKTYAYISTSSLTAAGAKNTTNGFNSCSSQTGALGSFSKVNKAGLTDDPNQPWWNRLSGLREAATGKNSAGSFPPSAKEYPDFFVLFTSPQSTCSDKQATINLQSSQLKAINSAVSEIQLLE